MDDRELSEQVQQEVMEIWPKVTSQNLRELTDFDSYKSEFLRLFGFGVEGVDYGVDADISAEI